MSYEQKTAAALQQLEEFLQQRFDTAESVRHADYDRIVIVEVLVLRQMAGRIELAASLPAMCRARGLPLTGHRVGALCRPDA